MGGLFGFKWEPWNMTFGSGRSVEALRWLARNPHIRVVHNLHDPLDVLVSGTSTRTRAWSHTVQ
jgi:hypothetical protein